VLALERVDPRRHFHGWHSKDCGPVQCDTIASAFLAKRGSAECWCWSADCRPYNYHMVLGDYFLCIRRFFRLCEQFLLLNSHLHNAGLWRHRPRSIHAHFRELCCDNGSADIWDQHRLPGGFPGSYSARCISTAMKATWPGFPAHNITNRRVARRLELTP